MSGEHLPQQTFCCQPDITRKVSRSDSQQVCSNKRGALRIDMLSPGDQAVIAVEVIPVLSSNRLPTATVQVQVKTVTQLFQQGKFLAD